MRVGFSAIWTNVLLGLLLLSDQPGLSLYAEAFAPQAVPTVSGIRIEPILKTTDFIGYNDKGASIVEPDSEVRVVILGYGLEQIEILSFVVSGDSLANCSAENAQEYYKVDWELSNNHKVLVKAAFKKTEKGQCYHLCYRENGMPDYKRVDDARTWISTQPPPREYYFPLYFQITIVAFLLVLSGLFSGLNLGLMSLTTNELQLIIKSGSKTERRYAEAILPIREQGNLLLCSLLIGNVLVNSGISILLDDLTSGYVALLGASAGIVVFGEIFPQSLCVKKGLAVGAKTIWVTRFFMVITWPIAFPISKLLDCILGEEVIMYDRKRLMELLKMSNVEQMDELKIAVGAMEISDKTVSNVMTKIDDVFMLPDTTVLNTKTVAEILRMGYTRIPVYSGDRNTVVSLLFVKDLALLDPDDNFTIQTVCGYHNHPLRFVMFDTPLRMMLEEFKRGDYHLALVQMIVERDDADPEYKLVGVCTLEDIVEEILQAEIVDETDAVMDNVNRVRRTRDQQTRDAAVLMDNDGESRVISHQMQIVCIQWLTTNHRAFCAEMIGENVLEKLVKQHCRRVELSHLPHMYDPKTVIPRTAKLYTKQEFSDKFILILEGRALVTIGQDAMTFEAGPWQAFGMEMLERLLARCDQDGRAEDLHSKNSLSLQTGTGDASARDSKKLGFVPDYSVIVRDDCTFLEVTAQNWMLAYKTTMINRGATKWPSSQLLNTVKHAPPFQRSYTDGCALYRQGDKEDVGMPYDMVVDVVVPECECCQESSKLMGNADDDIVMVRFSQKGQKL